MSEPLDDSWVTFGNDLIEMLVANILSSLPDEHRKYFDKVELTLRPSKRVNCYVTSVGSDCIRIVVNIGTISAFLYANKILLASSNVLGMQPSIGRSEAAPSIGGAMLGPEGYVGPSPELPMRLRVLASMLTTVQIQFLIGHELSHHLAGHLNILKKCVKIN